MSPQYPRFARVTEGAKRFRASDLLPVLAAVASEIDHPDPDSGWRESWRELAPWSLAAIARECLIRSNEHRAARTVTRRDVLVLNDLIRSSYDKPKSTTAFDITTPVAYEQFPWQESDGDELLRSVVLFDELWRRTPGLSLTAEELATAFGAAVVDMVAAAGAIFVAASVGNGSIEPALLRDPVLLERCSESGLAVPTAEALSVVAGTFTADQAGMRADYQKAYPDGFPTGHQARYAYNPLTRLPLVQLPSGLLVAPAQRFVTRRASPAGLYYAGVDYFNNVPGSEFTKDFGAVVEAYVGENLRLLNGVEVLPEIRYLNQGSEAKSVDWIVVFDDLVLLLEAKAARPKLTVRTGSDTMVEDFGGRLNEAAKQINRTARLIRARHADFAHIPADLPIVGLGVTAEPFYTANSPTLRASLPEPTDRILFASLRDLERLVLYPSSQVSGSLLEIADSEDLSSWVLSASLAATASGDPPLGETPMLAVARARLGL